MLLAVCTALNWGQTWNLTSTMTATLDAGGTLTVFSGLRHCFGIKCRSNPKNSNKNYTQINNINNNSQLANAERCFVIG